MPVHPQVAMVLNLIEQADNPPYTALTPPEARAQYDEKAPILDANPVDVHDVTDAVADGPNGPVPVRVYSPTPAAAGARAGVVWIHGGGHVIGSVASYDATCRRLCAGSGAVVVSVDYRLAPEHKFPAAVEDAFAGLQWTVDHAQRLGIDPARIGVAGDSAGGNLAAVCALMARDAGIALRAQALVYPVVAPDAESDSHHANAEGLVLTRELILWFQNHYRRDDRDREDWRYAPLIAPNLSGVAPALVLVAEFDPLRDEGIAYAERLMAAGVEVRLSHYAGMVHAFFNLGKAVDAANRAMDEVCVFLHTHCR